ncbi:MAG TPA: hypothetical protein VIV60_23605 [Polyangiaceae bacterium]
MKEEIGRYFRGNLERVLALVTTYEDMSPGVSGRPTVARTDILRASVVFLHASLEDLLRGLLRWKLPIADAKCLEDVPLYGEKLRKLTLADIAQHRGMTVDDLVADSVASWMEHSNFNNLNEVASVLSKLDLPKPEIQKLTSRHGANLEAMMKRRHWIVHRADRNGAQGSGQFVARSLHPDAVRAWASSVRVFGEGVLDLL